jgi:hypothetical protein
MQVEFLHNRTTGKTHIRTIHVTARRRSEHCAEVDGCVDEMLVLHRNLTIDLHPTCDHTLPALPYADLNGGRD